MKEYRYQTLEEEQDDVFENDSVKEDHYPSTFEELKYFIQNEDIPDINVFGLHVGEDSKKTGESGIFEDNGEYVVYQNGYDGHKDILYRGPNEAFAVKQFSVLFMKEKEAYQRIHRGYEEKKKEEKKEKVKKELPKKTLAIIGVTLILLFAAVGISNSGSTPATILNPPDQYEFYTDDEGNLYHLLRYWEDSSYEDQYVWCVLEKDAEEWKIYDENLSRNSYPEGVSDTDTTYPDIDDYNCSERELYFYDSKLYLDYNNWEPYENGYYQMNGELYYYVYSPLDSYYGESATCKQGWYHHDKETNTWEYLGTHKELKEINEDLWYYFDYCEYYFDLYEKGFDADQQPTRFEDTDFYENFLNDMELYNRKTGGEW